MVKDEYSFKKTTIKIIDHESQYPKIKSSVFRDFSGLKYDDAEEILIQDALLRIYFDRNSLSGSFRLFGKQQAFFHFLNNIEFETFSGGCLDEAQKNAIKTRNSVRNCSILFVISLFLPFVSVYFSSFCYSPICTTSIEPASSFARGGALTVAVALYMVVGEHEWSIYPDKTYAMYKYQMATTWAKRATNFAIVFGTVIWGYGDLFYPYFIG